MRANYLLFLAVGGLQAPATAQSFSLGTAQSFAILGGSTVTNTGASTIVGDVGVYPGTTITGFSPGSITGTTHAMDAVAMQAHSDVITSYNALAGLAPTQTLTGQGLGGLTLQPGVYRFASSAQLSGILTLNAMGNSNALFAFQIGSTLTTASNASVVVINGANAGNIFWQVGTSATLGTQTNFAGNILADQSISLNAGANILGGRTLAQNGSVTLDTNAIRSAGLPVVPGVAGTFAVPEPGSLVLLAGLGLTGAGFLARRRSQRRK